MKEIRTTADIHATPQQVWDALANLGAYHEWNPFIVRAQGTLAVGSAVQLELEAPGSGTHTVRPVVLEAEAPRELRWLWGKGMSGLCDSEQAFVVVPKGENRTHVIHRLTVTGLALSLPGVGPATAHRLETNFREGMEAMNRALKARAQGGKGPGV